MSEHEGHPLALVTRRATPVDAARVHALLAAAGDALAARGFTNWIPAYPLANVERDVVERAVYLVEHRGGAAPVAAPVVVGTFMLGPRPHRPYTGMSWAAADEPAQYLNRMAIAPAWHGHGIGSWCLAEMVRLAREAGAGAVRCDVYEPNLRTRAFYERGGFVARGTRSYGGRTFVCYERVLDATNERPFVTEAS
jgi:GNAT superfamily N-acetyltransferase